MTESTLLSEMQLYVGNLGEDVAKQGEKVSDMEADIFDLKTSHKAMIKLLWSIQEKQIEHDKRFDGLDNRMDVFEGRMDQLESRMDKLEDRMDKLESRMDSMEDILKGISQTLTRISSRLDDVTAKVDTLLDDA